VSPGLPVGVVGVGHLGRHHARLLADLDGVDLIGVVDTRRERAEAVAAEFHTRAYTDFRELLGKTAAVTIAAPTPLHAEQARVFLEAGVHTLVEKPLAASVADGERLVAVARERGVVLAVGHSERFNPALKAARGLISRPGFVEVHRLAPFSLRGTDVDVVLDLMIHDIDLVLHLLGEQPEEVAAVGVPVLTELVDIANARLTFPCGAVVNLTASRVSRDQLRKIRFFARDTYASLDTAQRRVEAYRLVRSGGRPVRIEAVEVPVEESEPLAEELRCFCKAAVGAEPPPVSGSEALEALVVAERILDAIKAHAAAHPPVAGE
jgi:predicted dehydrogenase